MSFEFKEAIWFFIAVFLFGMGAGFAHPNAFVFAVFGAIGVLVMVYLEYIRPALERRHYEEMGKREDKRYVDGV